MSSEIDFRYTHGDSHGLGSVYIWYTNSGPSKTTINYPDRLSRCSAAFFSMVKRVAIIRSPGLDARHRDVERSIRRLNVSQGNHDGQRVSMAIWCNDAQQIGPDVPHHL